MILIVCRLIKFNYQNFNIGDNLFMEDIKVIRKKMYINIASYFLFIIANKP